MPHPEFVFQLLCSFTVCRLSSHFALHESDDADSRCEQTISEPREETCKAVREKGFKQLDDINTVLEVLILMTANDREEQFI